MEQISTNSSVLDLDLSDIEDSETETNSADFNRRFGGGEGTNHLITQRLGGVEGTNNLLTQRLGGGGGGGGEGTDHFMKESQVSPKTPKNVIQMFSNILPGRGKELLNEAGLGVDRVVAVTPSIPKNQYWMLPGAVYDD